MNKKNEKIEEFVEAFEGFLDNIPTDDDEDIKELFWQCPNTTLDEIISL